MKRYFFDLRDGEVLAVDHEGSQFRSFEAAQEEAVATLAEMAKRAVPAVLKNGGHRLTIEVRDESGLIMKVLFTFELDRKGVSCA
jgi:Domain of unknown function (DUF6894)